MEQHNNKQPKGFKRGEKHQESETKKVKEKNSWQFKFKNALKKFKEDTPSNVLQKVYMISSLLFSVATIVLAILTINSYAKIEGMKDVLETFKPKVRMSINDFIITQDSLKMKGTIKNYGTRGAINIVTDVYIVSWDGVKCLSFRSDTLAQLEDSEADLVYPASSRYSEHIFPTFFFNDSDLQRFAIATKTIYTDAVTDKRDSAYDYSFNESKGVGSIALRFASKYERHVTEAYIHVLKPNAYFSDPKTEKDND